MIASGIGSRQATVKQAPPAPASTAAALALPGRNLSESPAE